MKTRFIALLTVLAAWGAVAQELTPIWVQHHNGLLNVSPADKVAIVIRQTGILSQLEAFPPFINGDVTTYGSAKIKSFENFLRYDDDHYLLAINENGIDEASETDPELVAAALAYPDRSLVWIDAHTGAGLGVALEITHFPLGPGVVGPPGGALISSGKLYYKPAFDQGPYGDRALYVGYEYRILRYAPTGTVPDAKFANGRPTWSDTPDLAWVEPVPGEANPTVPPWDAWVEAIHSSPAPTGPDDTSHLPTYLGSSSGDGSTSWRWKALRVSGSGVNTKIWAGGGTWRQSSHAQEFITRDGLTFYPVGRLNDRGDGFGAKRNYALGGEPSSIQEASDGRSWVIQGHYPGTGWGARPGRYTKNPAATDDAGTDGTLNANDGGVNHKERPHFFDPDSRAAGTLPAFCWESAGTCGNGGPVRPLDGVQRYDGNWSIGADTKEGLDYIVNYSMPSWNQQFGGYGNPNSTFTYGWVGVHTLDGNISPGNSSWKLPCQEFDELIADNGLGTGHDYGYSGSVTVYPDPTSPPGVQRSLVLAAFGEYGFGVFKVENKAVAGTLSAPTPVTVLENRPFSLSSSFTGSGTPLFYQWQQNVGGNWAGVAGKSGNVARMGGTANPIKLGNTLAALGDAGTYRLAVSNQLGVIYSAQAAVTVNPDTAPPVVAVTTSLDGKSVDIQFDELLDPTVSPLDLVFNVQVEDLEQGGQAPLASALIAPGNTTVHVLLDTGSQLTGRFRAKVANIKDLKGNAMSGDFNAAGHTAEGTVQGWTETTMGDNQQGYHIGGGPGEYGVTAGGGDVWAANDSINFLYKEVSGDFDYQVRVVSVTQPNNRDGIMARQSTSADAAMACELMHGGQEPAQSLIGPFYRPTNGGQVAWVPPHNDWDSTFHLPDVWLRLRRIGNTFTMFKSKDGSNWVQDGVIDVEMTDPVLLGLATDNSGSTTTLTQVKYSDYKITPAVSISGDLTLRWFNGTKLQSAPAPSGPWTDVPGNPTSPYTPPGTGPALFYRLISSP